MELLFLICIIGEILVLIPYYYSIEHQKLIKRFGKKKGQLIGEYLGYISGWGLFVFWIGIWIVPQPRFTIPFMTDMVVILPFVNYSIPVSHILLGFPFLCLSLYFGLVGVKEVTLKVSESHRTEKIVNTGIYSRVRHPQYLAAMLAHISLSFLLSGLWSLIMSPIMIFYAFILCVMEEKQLIREFGEDYTNYRKDTPMLIPRRL